MFRMIKSLGRPEKISLKTVSAAILLYTAVFAAVLLSGCGTEAVKDTSGDELLAAMRASALEQPWGETQSLTVATESSEVSFNPPPEEALPKDPSPIPLLTYRYMTGTVEALYRDDEKNTELRIIKSSDRQGGELTAGYRSSGDIREETFEGLKIHCTGDGTTYLSVWYAKDDDNYAIVYDPGPGGGGLTGDELKALINAL